MKIIPLLMLATFSACKTDPAKISGSEKSMTTVTETYPNNGDYIVQVRDQGDTEWKTLFTHNAVTKKYSTGQLGNCGFVIFDSDFARPVEVKVTKVSGAVTSASIRPLSKGITFTLSANQLQFVLNTPQKISVEFNGDIMNNLFFFANPPEQNKPNPGDPGVIYFAPGIHNAGDIIVSSGQTVYLADGALVYGHIWGDNATNVTIRGRGILDGAKLEHNPNLTRPWLVGLSNCSNVTIEGIVMRDAPMWTTVLRDVTGANITNVKQICYNENSDGFDIVQSQHVIIDDVFVRNHDDNFSAKVHNGSATTNITMKNSTLWADRAHNMLVGPEANGGTFDQIKFDNIDVLENAQNDEIYPGVMAVMAADAGIYKNIHWNNIRVENFTAGKVFCVQYSNAYSTMGYGLKVQNIRFSNITYNGTHASQSKLLGYDATRNIDTVQFTNYKINGTLVTGISSGNMQVNGFVQHLGF